MIRLKRLITTLLVVTFFSLNAQNIEVTYVKAIKKFNDFSESSPKELKGMDYKLIINDSKGLFQYIPAMNSDFSDNERYVEKGVYYKDYAKKEKISQHVTPLLKKKYLVSSPIDEYDWVLTKESKVISGYTCYKAIAVYEVKGPMRKKMYDMKKTAWYTPEIPSQFGPAGIDGLPGLVLETSSTSFYFIATHIKFFKKTIEVNKPSEGINIDKEDFGDILFEEYKTLQE